jgi:hypothetical protein
VICALTLLSRRAQAEQARIALVRDPGADQRIMSRLRAELDGLGLEVVDVTANSDSPSALDDAARAVGAFAAVRLVPSVQGAEVWVADRVTGKTLLREVVVGPHQAADEVVAIRTVELLRVSLLELKMPERRAGEVAPTPQVHQLVPPVAATPAPPPSLAREPSGQGLWLRFGPAVATSPGGIGATAHGLVGVRWSTPSAFDWDAFALAPTVPVTVQHVSGSASILVGMLGTGIDVRLTESDWRTRVGAGAALIAMTMIGSAEPQYGARTETVLSGAPLLRFGIQRRLASKLFLGADVFGGVAMPRPVVVFAGQPVASWGRPFAAAALTLDFDVY